MKDEQRDNPPLPGEPADSATPNRTSWFDEISVLAPTADKERAFLQTKLETVRQDPNLTDEQRQSVLNELRRRIAELTRPPDQD